MNISTISIKRLYSAIVNRVTQILLMQYEYCVLAKKSVFLLFFRKYRKYSRFLVYSFIPFAIFTLVGCGSDSKTGSDPTDPTDPTDPFVAATEISLQGNSGSINTNLVAGADDYYKVTVSTGIYTFSTSSDIDTHCTLYDNAEATLDSDDDGGSGSNCSITGTLSAGNYFVLVRGSSSSDTGSYTIYVTENFGDLVVSSFSVDDITPTPGQDITLSATVRNSGDASSNSTTLRYYLSTDSTITTSDTPVSTDVVRSLPVNATDLHTLSITAPSTTGTYYYGACVDTVSNEADTTNNCSTATSIVVVSAPDLVVSPFSVNNTTPTPGQSITLSATVRNSGGYTSNATTLRYYLSTDSTISVGDTQVGTDTVGSLSANATSPETLAITAPSTTGTYYYGACVVAVANEVATSNNCSIATTIVVSEPPNLSVSTFLVNDTTLTLGQSITLTAIVLNSGDLDSNSTTLRYYLSTDSTITANDTQVGTDPVSSLPTNITSLDTLSTTAPSTVGTYYYGACVDTVSNEADVTNNCSTGTSIVVSAPDLEVPTFSVNDTTLTPGQSIILSAIVRNSGGFSSSPTTLRYYRSTNNVISVGDTEVGTDPVSSLLVNTTSSETLSTTAPNTTGTYYYGACVDNAANEVDVTNNCSTATAIVVSDPPDLEVPTFSVNNATPTPGQSITLSATVRNSGDLSSSSTTLRYYRSTNNVISASDTFLGTDTVSSLSANATSSETLSTTAPSTIGTYYYGACVDTVTNEVATSNNCSTATTIVVSDPSRSSSVFFFSE